MTETWREAWRKGIAPQLSTPGLEALRNGLVNDDPALLQRATTEPPPMQCILDWPVERACATGYAAWKGDGLETVGDVEEYFARVMFEADMALGEPAGCRHFLNWFDDVTRDEMRAGLVPEIDRELKRRQALMTDLPTETLRPDREVIPKPKNYWEAQP